MGAALAAIIAAKAAPTIAKNVKKLLITYLMHAFQINSHINENGILSVKVPKEWVEKDVNDMLVLEFLNRLQKSKPQKESLAAAFE